MLRFARGLLLLASLLVLTIQKAVVAGGKMGTGATWSPAEVPGATSDLQVASSTTGNVEGGGTCRSLNFALAGEEYAKEWNWNAQIKIGGTAASEGANKGIALKLSSAMTVTVASGEAIKVIFKGSNESEALTITCAGHALGATEFNGAAAKWQLADTMNLGTNTLTLAKGSLDLNGQTLEAAQLQTNFNLTRGLIGGTGTLKLTGTENVWTDGGTPAPTYSLASATAEVTNTSNVQKTFSVNAGLTLGTLKLTGHNLALAKSWTIGTLNLNNATKAKGGVKGTLVSGSTTLTVTEGNAELLAGMEVLGINIPAGTLLVKLIEGSFWEMSKAATGTVGVAEAIEYFPHGMKLPESSLSAVQTVTTLVGNGSASAGWVRLQSTVAGVKAKLKLASNQSIDYARVKDIEVEGGGILYCGANSVDLGGNNANVIFEPPPSENPVTMLL